MSDTNTAPEPVEAAPVEAAPVRAPAAKRSRSKAAAASTDAVAAEPAATVAEPAAVATEPAASAVPAQQVVYVEAPKPFVKKGNRGFGILIAIISAIIFAALYAVALVVVEIVKGQSANFSFITDSEANDFWAIVVVFAIGFVLLVLVVNRAGWAAHVLGSLFVAAFTWLAGSGAILLLGASTIPSNQVSAHFKATLFSSTLIVAALLAREISLWMGFAVASRGRKVKERNVAARVLYDQEIADKRAEYEQANTRAAADAQGAGETPVVVETPAEATTAAP